MAEPPSVQCIECRFIFEIDDMYLVFSSGFGVCEPCHLRIVEDPPKPMDKLLARQTQATLKELPGWI